MYRHYEILLIIILVKTVIEDTNVYVSSTNKDAKAHIIFRDFNARSN